jgi:hypothetical protein
MRFESFPQTIAWFREQYRAGNLVLKKPYQRNPVWTQRQKCSLIETILLQLPIPEIFVEVGSTATGDQKYGVIDGQQRIRAILQFVGAETDPEEAEAYNRFTLDKLEDPNSPWRNLSFADLPDDDKARLFATPLAGRVLYPQDENEIRGMFRRLNKYLTPLNNQELRNATYSGPFARLAVELADDDYWAVNKIVSPLQIRRMNDVEFVSELLIGLMHGPQEGSANSIDEYYRQYEDYELEFPGQGEAKQRFRDTLETIERVLPEIRTTPRWSNGADFYTLFVCVALLLRDHSLPQGKIKPLATALCRFAEEVSARLPDDEAQASPEAVSYVKGVEKRVNAKGQRAVRAQALRTVVQPCFIAGRHRR